MGPDLRRAAPLTALAAAAVAVSLLHIPPIVSGATIGVLLVATAAAAAAAARAFVAPPDAAVVGGLGIIAWVVASGLVADALPGGLDARNMTILVAALSLVLAGLRASPRFSRRPGAMAAVRRPGRGATVTALCSVLGLVLLLAALVVNDRTERTWLRPTGVVMDLVQAGTPAVEVVNRSDEEVHYRLTSTDGARIASTQITVLPHGRWSFHVAAPTSGRLRLDLYAMDGADTQPVRSLVLTTTTLTEAAVSHGP